MRLVVETECEHGLTYPHHYSVLEEGAWSTTNAARLVDCTQGSRRVVKVDYGAAFDAAHHIIWIEMELEFSDTETTSLARRVVDAALGLDLEES